jgi:hypothetical protein
MALRFVEDGSFVVFDERARANNAMAAFGLIGLVGQAVMTSQQHSRDNESAKMLQAFLESASCRDGFQAAFEDALRKAGSPTMQLVEERPPDLLEQGFDAVLEFTIEHCGFRMTNQASEEMAAFTEMRAKLVMADGKVTWDDRESIVSSKRTTRVALKSDPELARSQFEGVLATAGKRMAYNLVYP